MKQKKIEHAAAVLRKEAKKRKAAGMTDELTEAMEVVGYGVAQMIRHDEVTPQNEMQELLNDENRKLPVVRGDDSKPDTKPKTLRGMFRSKKDNS